MKNTTLVLAFLSLLALGCSKDSGYSSAPSTGSGIDSGQGGGGQGTGISKTEIITKISAISEASSCSKFSFPGHGKANKGYLNGMALSYAKSFCGIGRSDSVGIMTAKPTGNSNIDALVWYADQLNNIGLKADRTPAETLRALFTLGIGLGMRESEGKYCEGWDASATNRTIASEAEAGPFQTSYNALGVSPVLGKIYQRYLADQSGCELPVFSKDVSCRDRGNLGTGEGVRFQILNKSCPGMATEIAMTTLRVLRKHYGPINRHEATVAAPCADMLSQVQEYVTSNAGNICGKL